MSNRTFWFLSAVASTLIASAALMLPSPQATVSTPVICDESQLCQVEGDDDVPLPPGNPLEWYDKNFVKNPNTLGRLEACFAKNTPPDVVAFVEQTVYEANSRYQLTGRWSGAQGTPRTLMWSFAPDGLSIPGGVGEPTSNNVLFATLDAQFAAQGGRATWIARFQSVFDRWQALSGLTYTRVTSGGNDWDDGAVWGTGGAAGARGDIRISMHPIDGGSNILAFNQFPSNGDMVLDSGESWSTGSVALNRFLRNIVAHEHGHGMGLLHVCPAIAAKLMEPFLSTGYDGPRHDDVRAAQRHYGDVSGSNNTVGTARVLGLLEVGAPINLGALPNPPSGTSPANSSTLSIDGNGELDWYRFTLAGSRSVTVTVTPRGQQYASYSQDANCNNNVVNTDSLIMANLNVDLIGTDGVTVLATAALQPIGTAETIAGFVIPAAGDYFVRVSEGDVPSQSQLYLLDLSAASACTPVSINPIAAASTVCGSAYNSAVPTFTGTPPINWSLSGIPPVGVTINPGTGQVSWPSPTTSPTPHLIQVTATNACGNDTEILSLTVLVGDFNGDGVLNDLDLPQFVDHLLGLDVSRVCAADVNGDLAVDGLDLLAWVDLAQ
ncbi:MAG: matrixin family metalloprotease [Planctomycetota bacterium]